MLAIHSSAAYPLQENDSRTDLGRRTTSSSAASGAASISRIHHPLPSQRLDRANHHPHNHHHHNLLSSPPSTALTMKEFFLHRRQHALHAQQFHNSPAHPHQRSLSHPHQRTITTTTTTTTTTTASDFDLYSLQQHHRLHSLHLQQQQQQQQLEQLKHQPTSYHHARLHSNPLTANPHIAQSSTPTASAFTPTTPTATTTAAAAAALRTSVSTVVASSATVSPVQQQQQQQQQHACQKPSRPFLLPNHKRRHPNHLPLLTTSPPKTQTASPPSSPTTTATMTPTDKIEARMARLDSDDLAKEKIVVLLTGSFCPVHLQHTEILEAAKREIEASGNSVVLGGFLSPSHDSYVGAKLWREALVLNSDQRIALCQAQTRDSDWIDVDGWEANQDEFYDYYEVARRLERHLNALFQGALAFQIHQKQQLLQATHTQNGLLFSSHASSTTAAERTLEDDSDEAPISPASAAAATMSAMSLDHIPPQHQRYVIFPGAQQQHNYALQQASRIRVVYLCGADFVVRTGARDLTSGMVVVDRPVDTPTKFTKQQQQQQELPTVKEQVYRKLEHHYGRDWCDPTNNNLWFLPSRSLHPSDDVSSTRIRRLLGKRESCDGLLHPAVMALLEQWLKNSVPVSQQSMDYW